MSTLVSQPAPSESWKQEVNQRLAAHKKRKRLSSAQQELPVETRNSANTRAAQAAARVAARYAKAPSYSEMQAAEARAALRAAETATRAALEAQAAAQAALASLETAAAEQADREANKAAAQARHEAQAYRSNSTTDAPRHASLQIRWEPDMPIRSGGQDAASALQETQHATKSGDWWERAVSSEVEERPIEAVEPAQPIHANLIEFPRELIATRRVRPRMAGSRDDGMGDLFGQLSIFEVDPGSISTEATAPADNLPAPLWSGPAWSLIALEELAESEAESQTEAGATLHLAPLSLRLMASLVDAALIVGVVSAAAVAVGHFSHRLPAMKTAELGAIAALLLAGILYNALFLVLGKATPGMGFARISLCTFDDECPSRAQLRGRLGAMLLSLLPVGLGVMWSVFDEDHLCWHDRLSRTYLRKC